MSRLITLIVLVMASLTSVGQNWQGKFEQLGTTLPTPNEYRTASGAPGQAYWQQKADYSIAIVLNDENQSITGTETITYTNNSPDPLTYIWLQLDQNMRAQDSNSPKIRNSEIKKTEMSTKSLQSITGVENYDGGFKIASVTDTEGKALPYIINQTMMRVDLPITINTGDQYSFSVSWSYNINDRMQLGGRSGFEYFPKDGNALYTIAQFFPRMAVYSDVYGWQNKQFLGRGEFTLTFGDYDVSITVPADHIIGATGELQNAKDVLTKDQIKRFELAKTTFDKPVIIVTQDEAIKKEQNPTTKTKVWNFKATQVRDFAFATSRKFIWDAMAVKIGDKTPLAMSYYPKEGNPLWEEESTKAVANTITGYSKRTIDYPYPVAISVHSASIGMEYPMICFNFGRPAEDGTYSDRTKYGMISVIVHEVGHNFFPMIINSDERQWSWMDEGLDTFVQSLTTKEYYPEMPSRRGSAASIVNYMKGDPDFIRPIMTNSEQITQFGNNAYAKPAAALSILRETVMGPELFDYAFKEYAERWAFKHPEPADFFRTMEDASAVDLDWFWNGWFYTTDYVDIEVSNVRWFKVAADAKSFENKAQEAKIENKNIDEEGNNVDFSGGYEQINLTDTQTSSYREFMNNVDDAAIRQANANKNLYEITLKNKGGLVMPVIIEWTYKDGTKEIERLPAEIWRMNENQVTKVFAKSKEVTNITLDPMLETADVKVENNYFPKREVKSKFEKFKDGK
ncbi:MAG: M1 family peptidase [Bacteroidetes bacterium]|nr:MAG: M1 family peptidase [Bacteroidota bacterium]